MPGEDEIRRQQAKQTRNLAQQLFSACFPKVEYDPLAMRRKLAEEFRRRTEEKKP